jgi:hypothetical protein
MNIFAAAKPKTEPGLLKALEGQIRRPRDDARMIAARERLESFEKQKAQVLADLARPESAALDDWDPRPAPASAETDVEKLLNGGSLGDMVTAPNRREGLLRSLRALSIAIDRQREEIRLLSLQVVAEICRDLEPSMRPFQERVLGYMENLLAALKEQEQAYQLLSLASVDFGCGGPTHWQRTSIESVLLFGGFTLPCAEWYIRDRRKHWHLDIQKEGK